MILGLIAGIIGLLAFVPYILSILKGQTKPHRATWFVWTVVGFTNAVGYFFSGGDTTVWVPLAYLIGPLIITLISIKCGVGGWELSDKVCLLGAGCSLLIWWTTGSPFLALITSILADVFGWFPSVIKTYKDPTSEDRLAWIIFLIADSFNILATTVWVPGVLIYNVYVGFMAITMVVLTSRTTTDGHRVKTKSKQVICRVLRPSS